MRRTKSRKAKNEWRSCCFTVDRRLAVFVVQTVVGILLLAFCAVQLTVTEDCHRSTPYWGLIGTVIGFFFQKLGTSKQPYEATREEPSATASRVEVDV